MVFLDFQIIDPNLVIHMRLVTCADAILPLVLALTLLSTGNKACRA